MTMKKDQKDGMFRANRMLIACVGGALALVLHEDASDPIARATLAEYRSGKAGRLASRVLAL